MKHVFLASTAFLALSVSFGWSEEAQAATPSGERFCETRISGLADIVGRVKESLATDPAGNRAMRGCIATPNHVLISYQRRLAEIKKILPNAELNRAQDLIDFFGRMVELEVEHNTEYETDCLHRRDGRLSVVVKCTARYPHDNEKIFGLKTERGEIGLLMQDCVNPGATKVEIVVTGRNPCIEVRFPSMDTGVPVRFAYIGPADLPGRCHRLNLAGENRPRENYPEECEDRYRKVIRGREVLVVCSWEEVEENSTKIRGKRMEVQNASGSFKARANGTNSWFLPPEALDGLPTVCWELPDGTFRTLSVGREHFVNGVATITAEQVKSAIWR